MKRYKKLFHRLEEDKRIIRDAYSHQGKIFTIGVVDVETGGIIQVADYDTCVTADWHHSNWTNEEAYKKIGHLDACRFWFYSTDNGGHGVYFLHDLPINENFLYKEIIKQVERVR